MSTNAFPERPSYLRTKGLLIVLMTHSADSTLYVMGSGTDPDSDWDVVDRTGDAGLKLRLPAQHAAMALMRKSNGAIAARYKI
jgi:hypothetical protein